MNLDSANVIALVAALLVGPFMARFATKWIAGFNPRYAMALLSTLITVVIINVIAVALDRFAPRGSYSSGSKFLIGWVVLSCTHFNLLSSSSGVHVSAGKGMLIAFCQIIGVILVTVPILFAVVLVSRTLQ